MTRYGGKAGAGDLASAYEEIRPPQKRFKRGLASVILWFLGRGFQAAAHVDSYVQDEVRRWEDGTTIVIGVAPDGPHMAVRKQGDGLRFLGNVNVPVSYTHLDVYKRQSPASWAMSASSWSATTPIHLPCTATCRYWRGLT